MVFIVVISSVLLAVCTSLKPIYLQNAIDAVDAGAGGALAMFLCYVASILGILLFETARQLSTGKYRNSRLFSLKRKVMAHIVYMPPRKFQEQQGQNYVTTLNNEIEMLVDSYYVTRLELAYSILVLITCVIALLYINGYLAMIIIVSTVCPIVASAVQGKALEKRTNFYTMALEKLNVMIGNLIHGYPTIKVNHIEREYLQTLEQDNEKAAHAEFAKAENKNSGEYDHRPAVLYRRGRDGGIQHLRDLQGAAVRGRFGGCAAIIGNAGDPHQQHFLSDIGNAERHRYSPEDPAAAVCP